jgi:hypothetical protein
MFKLKKVQIWKKMFELKNFQSQKVQFKKNVWTQKYSNLKNVQTQKSLNLKKKSS